MKIRQGFVSNSSSSSFIIAFKDVPESAREMLDTLFPGGEAIVKCYDHEMFTTDIAEQVFADIQKKDSKIVLGVDPDEYLRADQCFATTVEEKIFRAAALGKVNTPREDDAHANFIALSDSEAADPDTFRAAIDEMHAARYQFDPPGEETDANWDELYKIRQKNYEKWLSKHVKKFLAKTKGYTYYLLDYSDNDGPDGTLLEHGDIFSNIPHIRISNH